MAPVAVPAVRVVRTAPSAAVAVTTHSVAGAAHATGVHVARMVLSAGEETTTPPGADGRPAGSGPPWTPENTCWSRLPLRSCAYT